MTIALVTAGTPVAGSGAAALTPAYPAGVAANRVALIRTVAKPDTGSVATPGGYTSLANGTGGTGAVGIDTGPTRAAVFYRVLDGSETGTVSVTHSSLGANGVCHAVIDIYSATNGFDTANFGGTTGQDATHGTSWSAAMLATLGFANGDYLAGTNGCCASTSTQVSEAVTATGMTVGSIVAGTDRAVHSATGNDMNFGTFDFPVTGGPATSVVTFTQTTSVNNSGCTAIVRLVESAAVGATVTPDPITVTTTLPAATTNIGVTPTTLATVAALPDTDVSIGVTPVTFNNVVALPQATPVEVMPDVTVTPATIPVVAALPQTGVGVGTAPAVIAASTQLPQSIISVGVTPAVLAALTALPQASVGVGAVPAAIAVLVTFPDTDISVGVAPAALSVVVALPQATAEGGAAGNVTATPAVIAVVVALPQATVLGVIVANAFSSQYDPRLGAIEHTSRSLLGAVA